MPERATASQSCNVGLKSNGANAAKVGPAAAFRSSPLADFLSPGRRSLRGTASAFPPPSNLAAEANRARTSPHHRPRGWTRLLPAGLPRPCRRSRYATRPRAQPQPTSGPAESSTRPGYLGLTVRRQLHAHLSGSIDRDCLHEIWTRRKQADDRFDLHDPLDAIPPGKVDYDLNT